NPERALEELNSDWTASQELADILMREHKLPFRVGHHFASSIVDYAKQKDIKPLDFPYDQAKRIYAETVKGSPYAGELPMTEQAFRAALDPVAIIKHRASSGGPQPAEMTRMLALANTRLTEQNDWIKARRSHIDASLQRLDADFSTLVAAPK
ncbi:MAG: argininosuccinate lyase, partial [Comamonadaceae bacterium]